MANNSRSEQPPLPTAVEQQQDTVAPSQPVTSRDSSGKIIIRRQNEVQSDQPIVTTTTTAPLGYNAFLPTLIPALQSGAYVLVIVGGLVAWSSRGIAINFMTKHISLIETLKINLDSQLTATRDQLDVMKTLTNNNEKLINSITDIAERNSSQMSREAVYKEGRQDIRDVEQDRKDARS